MKKKTIYIPSIKFDSSVKEVRFKLTERKEDPNIRNVVETIVMENASPLHTFLRSLGVTKSDLEEAMEWLDDE